MSEKVELLSAAALSSGVGFRQELAVDMRVCGGSYVERVSRRDDNGT